MSVEVNNMGPEDEDELEAPPPSPALMTLFIVETSIIASPVLVLLGPPALVADTSGCSAS